MKGLNVTYCHNGYQPRLLPFAVSLLVAAALLDVAHGGVVIDEKFTDPRKSILRTKKSQPIVVLSPENFDQVVNGVDNVLVDFYAPWCGHCALLEPKLRQVGVLYFPRNDVVIAKVDCDKYRALCMRFRIRAFPSLKLFPRGKVPLSPVDYYGRHDALMIANFVYGKVKEFNDAEQRRLGAREPIWKEM